ncbi:MAG: glycosyltransferase [Armatimonadetes bacterium]|nr:glycosyltransferase [Armatimonadota bacterium]
MDERIRIWFVSTALPGKGGAERVIYRLITEMDPQRFECVQVLLYERGDIGRQLAELGVPTFSNLAQSRKSLKLPFKLRRLAKQSPPDVLFTTDNNISSFWCSAMRRLGMAKGYVLGFHMSPASLGRAARLSLGLAAKTADKIVALAPAHQKHWERLIGASPDRFVTIPNGIDIERFHPPANKAELRKQHGLPDDRPMVGVIAYLKPYKNIPLFIEVAHRVIKNGTPCHFAIVGDGPEQEMLQSDVRSRGIEEHFVFPGAVDDPAVWHQMCDVEMLTSIHTEAFPLTFLEANACGTPGIGTDIGGVRDLVVDGETGYVVPSQDAEALTERLLELLNNPNKRAAMGAKARERAVENYSSGVMVKRYEELFASVAQSSK